MRRKRRTSERRQLQRQRRVGAQAARKEREREERGRDEILILPFCVYVFTLYLFLLCLFSYSGLIFVLTCSVSCPYCFYSRCGRLSRYSLSKGRLLYSSIFVHISSYIYIYIFRSQVTFILGELSETILLFVDSGGSEVGHVPLDVRND